MIPVYLWQFVFWTKGFSWVSPQNSCIFLYLGAGFRWQKFPSKIVPLGLDFTNKSDARSIGDYSFGGELYQNLQRNWNPRGMSFKGNFCYWISQTNLKQNFKIILVTKAPPPKKQKKIIPQTSQFLCQFW